MIDLFLPRACPCCGQRLLKHEHCICLWCLHELPLACHHRTADLEMKHRFFGRVHLTAATALLQFQKQGYTQRLLHQLKYRGNQQIGSYLGNWLGEELTDTGYARTQLVVPVPLHKRKLRKRGYNQVSNFAKKLALALDADYREDLLVRKNYTRSSVFKGRIRRVATKNPFAISRKQPILEKVVLLVDDVITTGTTLEHCASLIWTAKPSELRMATMFIA